jgi:uncharacterized protein YcbX
MPRCLMTTLAPDTGEKNFNPMKLLAEYLRWTRKWCSASTATW